MFDLAVLYALGHLGSDKEHPWLAAAGFALYNAIWALVPMLTAGGDAEVDYARGMPVPGVVTVRAFGFSAVMYHLLTIWCEDMGKWIMTMIIGMFLWFTLPFAIMQQVEKFF